MTGRPKRAWPFVTTEVLTGMALFGVLASIKAPWWVWLVAMAVHVVNNLCGWHEGQILERERPYPTMTAAELAERIARGERWSMLARREQSSEGGV